MEMEIGFNSRYSLTKKPPEFPDRRKLECEERGDKNDQIK